MAVKRFICIVIACLFPLCAIAETYDTTVIFYNVMANEYGLSNLPEAYTTEIADNGSEKRTFDISDTLKVILTLKGDDVYGFTAVCLSEESRIDFLAICASGAFTIDPENATAINASLLSQFLFVCAGKKVNKSFTENCVFGVSDIGGGRLCFIIMKGTE